MIRLDSLKRLYFIGIGGIGMSALARYFAHRNIEIFGYDKVQTELTKTLENEGMHIHYDDDPIWIPEGIDLVVYTPAIPKDHRELNWFLSNQFTVVKRAEMLGWISRDSDALCVAGTHGKTTTSSMLSHILTYGKHEASCIIGGIMTNYKSNFIYGSSKWLVLEADEFDRSFLHLEPKHSAILSTDSDHLDIYGDGDSMVEGFEAFAKKLKTGGTLFLHQSIQLSEECTKTLVTKGCKIIPYGLDNLIFGCHDVRIDNGVIVFSVVENGEEISGFETNMPGNHNLENALVAIGLARLAGMDWDLIKAGLKSFKGIKRRFEFLYQSEDLVIIDDYAHHPTELEAAIQASRSLFPTKKITGIFQPHLFSRTNDFKEGFANALDKLDECILLDIYPARELPMKGVTSKIIYDRMTSSKKILIEKKDLIQTIKDKDFEVLMILGAGDIDAEIPKVLETLKIKND